MQNRECSQNTLSRDEVALLFNSIGMKFAEKRADDLFNRSNTDGDTTISVQEFIAIYKLENLKAAEKRKKIVENLIRIRKRNKGYCYRVTRLFTGSDVKQLSNQEQLDTYEQEQLRSEMLEMEEFANRIENKQG